MEWSKIKNIVLLMLLAVNLFLLVLVADQERRSAAYQEEARTGAVEILEAANIHIAMEELPPESTLHTMAVERDRAAEDAMAQALLGESVRSGDLGPVTYSGSRGEGQFLSDGKFSFAFEEALTAEEGNLEEHGQQLMEKAGYECRVLGIREQEDGKLIWECPNCGNRDQDKMFVARRTCGYIGTQFWNQGRTQEIRDRVLHL